MDGLIPPPDFESKVIFFSKRGLMSLQRQVGMTDQKQATTFKHLCFQWQHIAKRCLDCSKVWFKQSEARREAFIQQVQDTTHIAKRYKEHWPAISYARMYLRSKAYKVAAARASGRSTRKSSQKSTHHAHKPRIVGRLTARSIPFSGRAIVGRSLSPYVPVVDDSRLTPARTAYVPERSPALDTPAITSSSPSYTSSPVSATSSCAGVPPLSIETFISSLPLPGDAIAPKLKSIGITDFENLKALALLPSRDTWLEGLSKEGIFTWVQYRVISIALDKLSDTMLVDYPCHQSDDLMRFRSLKKFLASLRPSLAMFMPKFRDMGIPDIETLLVVAEFPDKEKDRMHYVQSGMLTMFQAVVLERGLEDLTLHHSLNRG